MVSAAPQPQTRWSRMPRFSSTWLAGLISVGFHGLLFAVGPTFPSLGFQDLVQPDLTEEADRQVPLIELSAAEQARLPDFSKNFYTFDSFDFESLSPLSPLFEGDGSAIPKASASLRPEGIFPPRSTSPLTRSRPPLSPAFQIPLGAQPNTRQPRSTPLETIPLPGALPSPPVTPQPSKDAVGSSENRASQPSGEPDAPLSKPGAAALERQPADPAATGETQVTRGSTTYRGLTLEEQLQAFTYDATATTSEESETLVQKWLAVGETLAAEQLARREETSNELETSPSAVAGTDPAAAEPEAAVLPDTIELRLNHGEGICLTEPPEVGLIGAWVGPEGRLLAEPVVLKSTGYGGLNQAAIQRVKELDFSAVQALTGYRFAVVVDYDAENCTELGSLTRPEQPETAPLPTAEGSGDRPAPPTDAARSSTPELGQESSDNPESEAAVEEPTLIPSADRTKPTQGKNRP